MTDLRHRLAVAIGVATLAASFAVVAAPAVALAGTGDGDCPFADTITGTECQITAAWTTGGGGVGANDFPAALPGPFAFHKTLHILAGGSIRAVGTAGITLNIDAAGGGTGALVMDAGASVIDTSEDGSPPNSGAGPLVITATGGAQLAAGSVVKSENFTQGGNAGPITMTLGATSNFAGAISSRATAGTTSNDGGDITIVVTGDLTLAAGSVITSEKNADSGESGDIAITVSGDMTMKGGSPGALITANHPNATNSSPGGNITIAVGTGDAGTFTMEGGSRIDSGGGGQAGNIAITAGLKIDVQDGAEVLAGQRDEQSTRGHGGRIFLVSGCDVEVAGTVSSQGQDPGADLVHLEGCLVHVASTGLVESIGSAHEPDAPTSCDSTDDDDASRGGDAGEVLRDHPDDSSVCIEIWARHVDIDAGGEVNADFALGAGTQGHGWIDIFAETDITIDGPALGSGSPYAVHSNSHDGNDVGGDVTIKAENAFLAFTGKAVQANATDNGGSGGHAIAQAGGNVTFDGASLQALGSQGTNAGHFEAGGVIEGRSFDGLLSGGPAGELNTAAFDTNGQVILQSCDGTTYTGLTAPGALSIQPDACPPPATPSFPAYVVFNPNGRWDRCGTSSLSGMKWDDQDGEGDKDAGEPGLPDWFIHVTGPGFDQTTTTDANGNWSMVVPGGQTYLVCEVLQDGWTQTYPTSGPPCGQGEGPIGYTVAVNVNGSCCGGARVPGIDFGNHSEPVFDQPTCQKQTVIDTMNLVYPGNLGPDTTVLTYLGQSVQDAVDNATDANGDTFIIVMVIAHADGSLGGTANQKVAVDKNYGTAQPFGLFGCSVTLTGGGSDPAVWIKSSATSKQILVNGKKTTIFVMDLHGGNSAVGVQADGMYRYLRNEYGTGNGTGIKVVGNYNTVHNGAATGNTADGVYVGGSYNYLTDTNAMSNGGNGFNVAGDRNQLLKLDAGEKGTGNTLDGVHVVGNFNTLKEIDAFANGGDGIDVAGNSSALSKNVAGDKGKGNTGTGIRIVGASNNLTENRASANEGDGFDISGALTSGTANLLKNNLSNTGAMASDLENAGMEWRFFNWIKNNGGGNKADGTTLASGVKGLTNFPGSGSSFNYFPTAQTAE